MGEIEMQGFFFPINSFQLYSTFCNSQTEDTSTSSAANRSFLVMLRNNPCEVAVDTLPTISFSPKI